MNWKKLEGSAKGSLGLRITDTYQQLYLFVKLMQLFAQSSWDPVEP
jgi:hypothetical protein